MIMKKSQLSAQMRGSLDKSLYVWNGKLAGRLIIAGLIHIAIGRALLERLLQVESAMTDIYFVKLGLGELSILIGVILFAIRRWNGEFRK